MPFEWQRLKKFMVVPMHLNSTGLLLPASAGSLRADFGSFAFGYLRFWCMKYAG